jgi:CheY-like chemotaxis protein/anti-sigma regulatory factor (Ser/Thr protein kinase)
MATLADVSIEVAREHRLAQAEAANVAKSQFLANMSHEIRTPLNGVLGMAQALALDSLAPSQHEKVQTIRDAGRSLLVLLNDILDLSKIDAGQFELETAPFDFEQMTKTICAIFAETAKAKDLLVVFTTRGDARGLWEGDANRCRQIVSNLLSNAIKFTDAGEVQVELERSEQGAIRLRVRDTGVGIDAADLPKLFSKFYQADSTSTRRFGGSGLGLSICQELSQMMGGAVTVDSALGEGSTFTLELPLKFLGAGAAATAAAGLRARFADGGQKRAPVRSTDGGVDRAEAQTKLRVLAAEDNLTNQLILKTLLQAFDANVLVVANGRLAVEAWEGGVFDLILMDIQMPEMDGVAATQRIRALEKELGRTRTPIVAVTANIMPHQVEAYETAGMDGYVAKPIQLEELSEALDRARNDLDED